MVTEFSAFAWGLITSQLLLLLLLDFKSVWGLADPSD